MHTTMHVVLFLIDFLKNGSLIIHLPNVVNFLFHCQFSVLHKFDPHLNASVSIVTTPSGIVTFLKEA